MPRTQNSAFLAPIYAYPCLIISGTFLLLLLSFTTQNAEASIRGAEWWLRTKRQTNVTSSGKVQGIGEQTGMSASNAMWKNVDGSIGANGSSVGSAGGIGNSNLLSSSNAVVGPKLVEGMGIASANGTMTKSSGQSSSNINGDVMSMSNLASGVASGNGSSRVAANGAGRLVNGNQSSPFSGQNSYGEAGATGNQMSAASVTVGQFMSWPQMFSNLYAISTAKGENNSQANISLRGGNAGNGIFIDGLVSGVNDRGGGSVFSQAIGSGSLNNQTAAMQSSLNGASNTTSGGSRMVGASSLFSNGTKNPNAVNTFGDLRLNGTGQSMGGLMGNASVNSDGTIRGIIGAQGISNGANKSINVNDGIRVVGGTGAPQTAIGRGSLEGTGNLAANGSSFAITNYGTGNGANMVVGSRGDSMAVNGSGSDLKIGNQGNFLNGLSIRNVSSNAYGQVTGEKSLVSGQAIMEVAGPNSNGNSTIVATGGGKGPSSALTDTNMNMLGANGAPRNTAIRGSVNANGDQTQVQSISNVADQYGMQSLFNSQNATVQGKGAAQAQASNYAVLKRRRRKRSLAHILDKLALATGMQIESGVGWNSGGERNLPWK